MAIVAGSQIEVGRGLLARLLPLTGTRASGAIVQTLTGPNAEVVAGNYLLPVVNGQLREELVYKVAPKPDGSMKWNLPADGPLAIVSNVGGKRHNLPAGTVMRWDPQLPGLDPTATVDAGGIAGGLDPVGSLVLNAAVLYESVGNQLSGVEFFRSGIGAFPAVVAMWSDSEPADGLATSSLRRANSRTGEGSQLYTETWAIDVVVSRQDSEPKRRAQGLLLMDEVTTFLTDAQTVDGVVISHPSGVQIRRRSKLTGLPRDMAQAYQIYAIELAVTGNYVRPDARTWAALERFNLDVPRYEEGPGADLPVVDDLKGTFPQ